MKDLPNGCRMSGGEKEEEEEAVVVLLEKNSSRTGYISENLYELSRV